MMNHPNVEVQGMAFVVDDEKELTNVAVLVDCIDSFLHQLDNENSGRPQKSDSNEGVGLCCNNSDYEFGLRPRKRVGSTSNHIERDVVQHNYHDFAVSEALEILRASSEDDTNSTSEPDCRANQICRVLSIDQAVGTEEKGRKRRRWTATTPTFPQTLYRLLEESFNDGRDHIVSWQPHGRSFRVHDQRQFIQKIMPKYFQQKKFTSFQRQLALYGFVRLTRKGADFGSYYHERFLRGHAPLAGTIQRTAIKGTWIQKLPSPETEPDFYAMEPVGVSSRRNMSSSAPSKQKHVSVEVQPMADNGFPGYDSDGSWYMIDAFDEDLFADDLLSSLHSMSVMTDKANSPDSATLSKLNFEPTLPPSYSLSDEQQTIVKNGDMRTRNTYSKPDQVVSPISFLHKNDDDDDIPGHFRRNSLSKTDDTFCDEDSDISLANFLFDVDLEPNNFFLTPSRML